MTLFFIIIIHNLLPFYHRCLYLEASNQILWFGLFGYLYRVYLQFFISFFIFQRLSNKIKSQSSFIVRELINSHLDIFSFLFYLASGNKTRQD